MQAPHIEFRQVRSFEQNINATFVFIRQNFTALLRTVLYIGGPALLIAVVAYGIFVTGNFSIGGKTTDLSDLLRRLPVVVTGIIAGIAAYMLLYGSVYEFIAIYIEKGSGDIRPSEVWDRLKHSLPGLLSISLLSILLIVVSLFFLVIPAIYFTVALMPVLCVKVFENRSSVSGIRRSLRLVSGNWWSTAGLTVVMSIIQSVIGFVFAIPMYVFTILSAIHESTDRDPAWMATAIGASSALNFAGNSVLNLLLVIAMAFQYFSLVEKQEHSGLIDRISSIGDGTAGSRPQVEHY